MNKLKKLFAVVTGCLITVGGCSGLMWVRAEDGFGDAAKFDPKEKVVLKRHAHQMKLMRVPLFKQAADYTCGEACLLSILRYAKYDFDIREANMSLALGSTSDNWVTVDKMVRFLNAISLNEEEYGCFKAECRKNMDLDTLKSELDNNHLVICEIQDSRCGRDGENTLDPGQNDGQRHEHSVLAIGYDEDNVFFMDPLTSANYTYLPNDELMDKWHDSGEGASDNAARTGIVVEICCTDNPDVEHYHDGFYGLM